MKEFKNRPIGVFDSGVGGLTVVKSMRRELPHEDIIYFGDTARVPYGNKSRSTITRFVFEIMSFMMKKKVKMVVVACNTASSLSLGALKNKKYGIPIVGVIAPGVKEAVRLTRAKRIGVIGTKGTISSGSYLKALKKEGIGARLFSESCPLFVPLVENKFADDRIAYEVAKRYLAFFQEKKIDTLILGCTHYPILKDVIKKVMKKVELVDSSQAVAREVKRVLVKEGLSADRNGRRGIFKCFVSDDVKGFRRTGRIFLKKDFSVKKAVL